MRKLFRQFSFPGGIPSHVAPETPGSIHEGGELGYALSHAYGAAFDNPDLIVCCVVGDGEAETGPAGGELALQQVPQPGPRRRRAADPAPERLQDRQPDGPGAHPRRGADELLLERLRLRRRIFVEGDEPAQVHQADGAALDEVLAEIRAIQRAAREEGRDRRPRWPMIVLRTPKGWTGPKDRRRPAGRGHLARAPGAARRRAQPTRSTSRMLEPWMQSYRPGGAVRRARHASSRSWPTLAPRRTAA